MEDQTQKVLYFHKVARVLYINSWDGKYGMAYVNTLIGWMASKEVTLKLFNSKQYAYFPHVPGLVSMTRQISNGKIALFNKV